MGEEQAVSEMLVGKQAFPSIFNYANLSDVQSNSTDNDRKAELIAPLPMQKASKLVDCE